MRTLGHRAFYIREHARRAGYAVDVLRGPKAGYDVG